MINPKLEKYKNSLADQAIVVVLKGMASSLNCLYADEESDKENSRITNIYWKLIKDLKQLQDGDIWKFIADYRKRMEKNETPKNDS